MERLLKCCYIAWITFKDCSAVQNWKSANVTLNRFGPPFCGAVGAGAAGAGAPGGRMSRSWGDPAVSRAGVSPARAQTHSAAWDEQPDSEAGARSNQENRS